MWISFTSALVTTDRDPARTTFFAVIARALPRNADRVAESGAVTMEALIVRVEDALLFFAVESRRPVRERTSAPPCEEERGGERCVIDGAKTVARITTFARGTVARASRVGGDGRPRRLSGSCRPSLAETDGADKVFALYAQLVCIFFDEKSAERA